MRFGLKFKISILAMLIVLGSVSPLAYWFISEMEETMRSELRQRAIRIAAITGSLSVMQVPGNENAGWQLTQTFINAVPQTEPMVLYIVVVDSTGEVRASITNPNLMRQLTGEGDIPGLSRKLKEEIRQNLLLNLNIGHVESPDVGPSDEMLEKLGRTVTIGAKLGPESRPLGMMGIGFSYSNVEGIIALARANSLKVTLVLLGVGIGAALALATTITRPIQALVRGMERVRAGDLHAEVHSRSQDEVGMLTRAFNFMTEGLRERERVKSTFKRYVSKDVAEKVLASTEEIVLTGERKRVSVLFADIRGFTSMSESMEPEEVVALLNEHFGRMIDVIFKHEGTLDKFMGDAIMAVFGAPVSHGNDAERAVVSALEMQETVRRLNELRKKRGEPPIQIGIGIATGNVVSGNIGSEQRTEFTVIGDTVNTASRIQGESQGGEVLINEETFAAVKDRFKTHAMEPIRVKGKKDSLRIYQVLDKA